MTRSSTRWLGVAMLAALLAAVAVPFAHAADTRIGFIDSAKLFQQYKSAQEAQARFDRQVQNWREEAAEKEKAVKVLRDQVRDQTPILSAARRQEREEALNKAVSEYEAFIQEIWGPTGRAAQENENSTREIIALIRAAVEKLAAARGLEMVLDAAGGSIIFASRELDLTADVLQELNTNAATTGGR
jgi:outer membrane protein